MAHLALALALASVHDPALLRPQSPTPPAVTVRYFFEGGSLKRGRLMPLGGDQLEEPADSSRQWLHGGRVLAALAADGVDLERFEARAHDIAIGGWAPLDADTRFELTEAPSPRRVDVQLFRRPQETQQQAPPAPGSSNGYFYCGVVGVKNAFNVGTLWRSCFQFGAAQIFTVGGRVDAQASDTVKAWRQVRAIAPTWPPPAFG